MELLWDGGTKCYINGRGHMTKMVTMPIKNYGKILKKSSSLEPSPLIQEEQLSVNGGKCALGTG